MKKLIGCLLLFLSTTCFAGYYDLQQQSIVKDTTTINNDWYMRGSYHIGRDTYTVSASGVPTKILLHSSGTIVCEDLNTGQGANELYDMNQNVETTSTPTFSSMTVTNGITAGNLITDSYDVDTQFALVATDTTTLQSNIGTEESARISADTAIGVTTGTLETNKLAKTDTFGGDVSGTYDDLQVDSAKGIEFATSTWTTTEYLVLSGTSIITGTPEGAGDVTAAGDNDFTGTNTHAGIETFTDFNTTDDGMYKLIYSTVTVATATTITISGLTGNTDEIYKIITFIKSAEVSNFSGTFNADGGANYFGQYMRGLNSGIASLEYTSATSMANSFGTTASGDISFYKYTILASSGNMRAMIGQGLSNTSSGDANQIFSSAHLWTNTTDELTSITITATTANGIGIGSRIYVYTRR